MIRPPEKTKTHGGNRESSENATAWGRHSEDKHNPDAMSAAILARVAMDAAQTQLDRYALATDEPAPGIPEAADLLDAALASMAGAP